MPECTPQPMTSVGQEVHGMKFSELPFEQLYEILEDLGSGQFAVVRRVTKRATGEQYAAKYIKKRRYATSRRGVPRAHIEREVEMLRLVSGHDNVIDLHEVFETPTDVILVLELVSGGELFDHVCANEYLNEPEAASFIRQILYGVQHLHDRFVVHLDIKPENIMLKRRGEAQIKLIDFGLSRRILPGATVKDMIGTPEFVAPEVVAFEPLSTATDLWAIGVVVYVLLSGGSPFLGRTREETFCNITAANYHFSPQYFGRVSDCAKDFIARLFVKSPAKRATVDDCLSHPWIRAVTPGDGLDLNQRTAAILSLAQMQSLKLRLKWKKAIEAVRMCVRCTRAARQQWLIAMRKGLPTDSKFEPEDIVTSAILVACEEGNIAALEQLINVHRLSLDVSNALGETPMHVSAGAGFEQMVVFLQRHGSVLDVEDRRGDTPLFWAARNGHAHLVRYFVDAKNVKVNVNHVNKNKETALHVATRYTQVESVLALLENGANVDVQDEHGETALHIASWHGYSMLLSILCRFGPSLDLLNKDDETALHCAATRGHLECVQSLLESGAPVDAQDQAGQTALHLALRRSHIDIALLLVTKGCNLDIQDENGDTPLIVASRLGLASAVQTLCHLGANADLVNSQSLTALHIAAQEGHIEIVRCLCLAGANVHIKTKEGLTGEIIALAQDHTEIGTLLAKMKSDQTRDQYVEQLCPLEVPLRRIKLKLFGHTEVGKSRLVQALQSGGMIGSIIDAVSRRFSDNTNISAKTPKRTSDEGIHSCASSTSSDSNGNERRDWPLNYQQPTHENYTHGIDVQNVSFPGCGEYSIWEFGGYEPYHIAYDHFVGNTDCIHVVVIRASDPTEVQYKQVLYWMNFLKGRVTPSEPIGHCGIVSRRSKVVVVGTNASLALYPDRNAEGEFTSSDTEAMMKTVRLRFETHFDIYDHLILLDSTNASCAGLKSLRGYLQKAREHILSRLQRPLVLLESCVNFLGNLRKRYANFPVITWPHFTSLVRTDLNPLASDSHCRQLIQQLQLIGEVVYLRDDASELDYVVLTPEWLGTHIIGTLLSAQFLSRCHTNGCYSIDDFGTVFPEIAEHADLLHILDTLQLCAPTDAATNSEFEFPAFILVEPLKDVWLKNRSTYVYGGMRILPMRGMERSLQSTFPRIQVAMRKSMQDFQDPMDADLTQWQGCSKMCSGQMEALVRLQGDAVEIQVRGPPEMSASCVYFLEDIANLVEQTASEVAPGISLERHFLSPKHLKEHRTNPATFPPEEIMAMQQRESLSIKNTDGEEELFTEVVCFGSREVAAQLTLGIDVAVSQLQLASRCELAALLDPPDNMGRDWSILAVKLSLADQLPEVDSTGQNLSRTDQLLAEWALQCPDTASVGRLCAILEEMGRQDARDALYRTVPLYLFAPLEETHSTPLSGCNDSGVVSSSHSTVEPQR